MSSRARTRRSRGESQVYDGLSVAPKSIAVIGGLLLALAAGVMLVVRGLM